MDAEFKMASKIRTYSDGKQSQPYLCCLAARGLRGLYLSALTPQKAYETGSEYIRFLLPILEQRRRECQGEPGGGRPDFVAFDSGPAYELFALAAVGHVWPEATWQHLTCKAGSCGGPEFRDA